MLAYVLYSKNLGLVIKALDTLKDEDIKFDVDLDKGHIYINEAEASRKGSRISELLEKIIVPRKCILRTVSCAVDSDFNIHYGLEGSGITTGTQGLLRRLKYSYSIEVMKGFFYYPSRSSIWVFGEGYFKINDIKKIVDSEGSSGLSQKVLQCWKVLEKLITV